MNLFGLTPSQVRRQAGMQLTQGALSFPNQGAAMIGAALGGAAGGLFSERNPEIARAQKLQQLQQDWSKTWDMNSVTPETMPKVAAEMARGLIGIGETGMAFQLMRESREMLQESQAVGFDQKQINTLRSSIDKFSKDQRQIDAAYEKIQKVSTERTATGDMSMIFGIMKLNDPGSTVREGEYATAQNAGGVSDRLRNMYNMAIDGQKLTEEQRRNFLGTADNLYTAQRTSTDRSIEQVLQYADEDKIPRSRVLGTKRLKALERRKKKSDSKYSQEDLEFTAKKHGITVEEVKRRLNAR